jgi:hypothetical protein
MLPGWFNTTASIINVGDTALTGLTLQNINGMNSILSKAFVDGLPSSLDPLQSVPLNFSLFANNTFSGDIQFVFTVTEPCWPLTLVISVHFEAPKPILQFSPSNVDRQLIRGNSTLISLVIKNVGNAETGAMQITLPSKLTWLSLSSSSFIPSLQGGENSTVTLVASPSFNESFAKFSGSLLVSSSIVASTISYSFTIVSDLSSSLLVTVQDEYTFVMAGSPLVSDAVATLTNRLTNQRLVINPCNGSCLFQNVPINLYVLDISAPKHSSSSQSMELTTEMSNVTVFLARQVVNYVFT